MVERMEDRILAELARRPREATLAVGLEGETPRSFEEALARVLAFLLTWGSPTPEFAQRIRESLEAGVASESADDLIAQIERDQASGDLVDVLLFRKGFQALATYRVAHAALRSGDAMFAQALSHRGNCVFGIDIHPAAKIAGGVVLDHGTGLVVGETAEIERGCYLFHGVTLGSTGAGVGKRHPTVREGAFLGAGCAILGDIEIGAGSVVAAGSVVVKPVPAGRLVGGVPAKDLGEAPVLLPRRR